MPAVVVGAASVWGGVTAWGTATSVLGYVTAGAMVVGGAMSVVGGLTDNKKLANDGMLIGAIGGLGNMALSTPSAAAPTAGGEAAAGAEAGVSVAAAEPAALNQAITAQTTTTTPAVGSASNTGMGDALARYQASTEAMMRQNTQAQLISGIGQGYSSYETSKAQRELADRAFTQEEAMRTKRERNLSGITNIQIPKVTAPKVGLINA